MQITRETINVKADNEQNATNNDPKKSISYRSYTDKLTANFISPIIEMVSVKDVTPVAGTTLSLHLVFEKCEMKTMKFLRRRKEIVLKRIC
jgi:hypothetical protein